MRILVSCLLLTLSTEYLSGSPVVSSEEWIIPTELVKENEHRGELLLNGWWEGRADASAEVERIAVPGKVKKRKEFIFRREFTLPAGWEKQLLKLELGRIPDGGTITFNGNVLLAADEPFGRFPYHEHTIPSEWLRSGVQEIEVSTGNLSSDVYLRAYPKGGSSITDSYMVTSFRKQTATVELKGSSKLDGTLRAQVVIAEDVNLQQVVKTYELGSIQVEANQEWTAEVGGTWNNPKLWTPDTPNLYHYTVRLFDGDGKLVDELLPRRFGFREVWTESKQMMLNGVPFFYSGDTWGRTLDPSLQMREQLEATFRIFKDAGLIAATRVSGRMAASVADEMGVIFPSSYLSGLSVPVEVAPALREDEAGDAGGDSDFTGGDREKFEISKAAMAARIRALREHPSIVIWSIRSPWSRVTLDTTKVGRSEEPWKYWPGNKNEDAVANNRLRYHVASVTAEFAESMDPYRPVMAQNLPEQPIELATRYLCDNLDLQERRMFFLDWYQSDSDMVLQPSEAGMPFPGHQILRTKAHQMPQGKAYPAIHLENAARLFGDEVFLEEPLDRFPTWHRRDYIWHKASPVYQRLTAENIEPLWLAWRTLGVNTIAHWVMREGYTTAQERDIVTRLSLPTDVDPRRQGRSTPTGRISNESFPFPGIDNELEGGTAYLNGIRRITAYIAGGAEQGIYNQDHIFESGETIDKSIVALNDTFLSVPLKVSWEFLDADGSAIERGPIDLELNPGERLLDRLPIRVTAPTVIERSEYTLAFKIETGKSAIEDRFEITVFPPAAALSATKRKLWYLGDPDAGPWLKDEALSVRNVNDRNANPRPGDLLMVLRGAFESETGNPEDALAVQVWQDKGIDRLINDGLNVIVFEQDVDNLLGLQTEQVRPRRAFATALEHPALAGLAPSDFTYWSGASDLQVDVPVNNTPEMKRFPKRLWQVSNENSVATRTIIRPQVGAARALLVSGFGLQETPLLEMAKGSGRLFFCMLDVSNRYGSDPVATRIVNQLIAYADSAVKPDPGKNEVKFVDRNSQEITEVPNLYLAAKPVGDGASGLTQAEFFFRESIYNENKMSRTNRPEVSVVVFTETTDAERPSVVRLGQNGRFEMSINEEDFTTGWAKQKVAWIRNALIINQGGSLPQGPAITLHGNDVELYPYPWLENFIHPYTAACW